MQSPIQIDDESSESDSDIYDVEFVYAKKNKKQKPFYAVKWVGFSIKQMTWEPFQNFTKQSRYLVQRFETRLAYQIYFKEFAPKVETIRVHIKSQYYQVFTVDSMRRSIFNQQKTKSSKKNKQQQFQIPKPKFSEQQENNEYLKAQEIIDQMKKELGLMEKNKIIVKQDEVINQPFVSTKQQLKQKKSQNKISNNQKNEFISVEQFPPVVQENQIKELKLILSVAKVPDTVKNKLKKKVNEDWELERDIQLLIQKEKKQATTKQPLLQEQVLNEKKEKSQEKVSDVALISKDSPVIEKRPQRHQNCQIVIEKEDKKKTTKNPEQTKSQRIIDFVCNEEQKGEKEREKSKKKKNNIKIEPKHINQEAFDIEINLNDELKSPKQNQLSENTSIKKSLPEKILSTNSEETCNKQHPITKEKIIKSAQLTKLPDELKFKLEREYLNDIIVAQRKKELEIYRSGSLVQVLQKAPKPYIQPRTSQELQQEIQRLQLEKIASNRTSRCSVPIIPKVKESGVQTLEQELENYDMTQYDSKLQLVKLPRVMIESIASHNILNNRLLFKCLYENGSENYLEYRSLSFYCPTLLLDYMIVNSLLI